MNCPFLLLFGGTVSFSPLILVAKKQSFDDKKITLNADKNHPRENVNLVLAIYWLCAVYHSYNIVLLELECGISVA